MDYKRLADVIRNFDNIEILANEIESLIDTSSEEMETIDDLTEFLEYELS